MVVSGNVAVFFLRILSDSVAECVWCGYFCVARVLSALGFNFHGIVGTRLASYLCECVLLSLHARATAALSVVPVHIRN